MFHPLENPEQTADAPSRTHHSGPRSPGGNHSGPRRADENYNGPRIVGGDLKTEGGSGSLLRDALLDISVVRGRDALLDPPTLEKELRRRGMYEMEISRLCLLCRVRGWAQLVDARSGQYDVERFVYHALRETGLRRDVVLDLAGTVASLSGVTLRAAAGGVKQTVEGGAKAAEGGADNLTENGANPPTVFPIPVGFYQEELDACRGPLQKALSEGTAVQPDVLARLRPLAIAGIPEARYWLGAYLLGRWRKETASAPSDAALMDAASPDAAPPDASLQAETPTEALDLLKAAASDGEPNAAAALADFYYARRGPGDWAEAFRRYTGCGAPALTDRRRIALVDILNQKNLNGRLFRYGAALLAALALLFLVPAAPLYGGGWVWCGAFLLWGGGTLWLFFRRFQREPYGEYYVMPASLLAAWAACWLLRVLL